MKVALVQNSAGPHVSENLERLTRQLSALTVVDLIALPEVFAVRGGDDALRRAAQPLTGSTVQWLRELARTRAAWVLGGSVMELDGETIYNTSLLINRSGDLIAAYRKIHLFEVHMEDGKSVREADVYAAGDTPVIADIDGWKCGFSICYDLRFPELYRHYAHNGCDLCFIPSNFTQRTGKDHWNVLVRARAIENQCFIIAPAQCGMMSGHEIETHGHSIAVGPWGEVLAEAQQEETILITTLDKHSLKSTRARVPALAHRKLF